MDIKSTTVSVTTTGVAGSATGSAVSEYLYGYLLDVYLNYHASAPATTDVTLAHTNPTLGNIFVKSNNATDIMIVPRATAQGATAADITNSFVHHNLAGTVTVSVAQSDALTDCVVVTIRWLKL